MGIGGHTQTAYHPKDIKVGTIIKSEKPYRGDHASLLAHALSLWAVYHCLAGCAYTIKSAEPAGWWLVQAYLCTSGRI